MRDEKDVKDEQSRPESSEIRTLSELFCRNSSQIKNPDIELQNSEMWYRALFENTNDAIFLMDNDRFIDCNPKTLEIFNCTKEQIIGYKPYDRFSPRLQPDGQTSKDKALDKIRSALEGRPQLFEWRHLRYDGTPFEAEVSLNRVEIFKYYYIQAFVRDVTKHKHIHLQYEMILKTAMDGFIVFQKDGNILEVNNAYCNKVGYSREELLSMNIADIEAIDSQDEVQKHIQEIIHSGSHRFETRHRCKDGKLIDLEVSVNNLELDGGRIFAFLRNITERKKMDEILRDSEKKYRSVIENANIGILIIQNGKQVFHNSKIYEMLGYTEEEYNKIEFMSIVHPKDRAYTADRIRQRLLGVTMDPELVQIRVLAKSGEIKWIEANSAVIQWEGRPAIQSFVNDITERKKAEQALKMSELRIRSLIEQTTDAVFCYEYDPPIPTDLEIEDQVKLLYNGVLVECNDVCAKSYGAQHAEEVIGRNLSELFGTTTGSLDELFTAMIKGGYRIDNGEGIEKLKDGTERYYLNNGYGIIEDNKILRVWGTFRDITDHKKAEAALAESEEKFRSFAEQSPNMIFINQKGRIVYANKMCEETMGYTRQEFYSPDFDFLTLIAPESQDLIKKNFKKHLKGKDTPPYEYTLINKAGERIEVINTSKIIQYAGMPAIMGIVTDITDRKQAEEELKKSEQRYRLLVEFASDSIFLMDMKGSFIDVNPAACDSLGRTREELLTLSVSDINPDWPPKKLKGFLRTLVVGKPVTIEGSHNRKNKTSFPVEIRLTKIDVDEGQVVLALARDITQRRRIEESLRKKAEIVSHLDKVHVSGIDIKWDHGKGVCSFEKLPVAMMWIDTTLAGLMSGLQAMVGAERFGLALQGEGRKSVEDDWRVISQFSDFKKGFKAIANIAAVAGWGDWKLIEINTKKKECFFRVWNSWEGLYQKVLGVCWGSGMLAGKLAGYCSMLFKENCWADQIAFIAKGDDFDEFRVHISNRSVEKEIENLLATDKATRADMAVALQNLRTEISMREVVEKKLEKYQEQLKTLALELSLAEERERRRIAAGIHDDIAQKLAFAKLQLQSVQETISDTDVLTSLNSQCETMDRIMEDARTLTFELSNPLLYEIGLAAAIESLLIEQIQEKSGINCTFTSQGPQIDLNEEVRVVLYQGVRELLTNIIKYAHASHVEVRVIKDHKQISIIVQDDGVGFDVSKLSMPDRYRGGFGLFNIRERLEFLGGNLKIESKPNKGTCVTMSIPYTLKVTAQ